MSEQNSSCDGILVWMLDDLFDANEIELMRRILRQGRYDLVVTKSDSYEKDYPRYAPHAKGVMIQVNFPLREKDIKGLTSCKIISVTGIGFDQLDLDAATKHGIAVTNAPGFCVEEVSDHALALLLALTRRLPECQHLTKKGLWDGMDIWSIRRITGRVLGLVGFGKIGRALARKAEGLGLRIIACDPYLSKTEINGFNVESMDFDGLVRTADYVSLHVPLNEETYHLINADVLDSMKDTTFLINTSRGDIVDEPALINALKTERIAGAGLDVLSQEPPEPQNPLLSMPNVIVSPHSAFISHEALTELATISTKSIIDTLEGKVPENLLNPEVLSECHR